MKVFEPEVDGERVAEHMLDLMRRQREVPGLLSDWRFWVVLGLLPLFGAFLLSFTGWPTGRILGFFSFFITALLQILLIGGSIYLGIVWATEGAALPGFFPTSLKLFFGLPAEVREVVQHPLNQLSSYQVFVGGERLGFARAGEAVGEIESYYLPEEKGPMQYLPASTAAALLISAGDQPVERRTDPVPELRLSGETELARQGGWLTVRNSDGTELRIPDFFPLDEIEREIRERIEA